ncbi:MAG: asparaginase [Immundisolibacterales bacterium]|nr:asparaginase [Immundisolibacterales bacterium]
MSTNTPLPRIAVIGTGGTISSVGRHNLELVEYITLKRKYDVHELLARVPEADRVANVVPIPYAAVSSTSIEPGNWLELNERIHSLVEEDPDLDGIVLTHGTATLEETAYFLGLTLKVDRPVVVTGAQRPASALSTDAFLNIVNALRVAGSEAARGLGVLVMLNDEIHAAREVAKTSTQRLQTFRTPDFGALGQADADGVNIYRHPVRRRAPDTEFDVRGTAADELPRVDVSLSYAGADGTDIDAYVAAGAKGIVVAGFAPGLNTKGQVAAIERAHEEGVVLVQSSRVGSGRVPPLAGDQQLPDPVVADNLTPWKARILLMLGLRESQDRDELRRMFATY